MSKIEMNRICPKCNEILQYTDPFGNGYITKENLYLHLNDHRILLCDKCYHEHRINEEDAFLQQKNLELYQFIETTKGQGVYVYVIDFISFEMLFDSNITSILKDEKVIVVVNKIGRIQAKVDIDIARKLVTDTFVENGIKPLTVVFINNAKNEYEDILNGFKNLIDFDKNVYIIGPRFTGKTTLIKSFLKSYNNVTDEPIILDNKKNQFVNSKIPIKKGSYLYEIDSFSSTRSLLEQLSYKTRLSMLSIPSIPVIETRLHSNISLCFGGLVEINFVKAPLNRGRILTYGNPYFSRKHISKDRFKNGLAKKKLIPTFNNSDKEGASEIKQILVNKNNKFSLNISGFGRILLDQGDYHFSICVPTGVEINTTDIYDNYIKK